MERLLIANRGEIAVRIARSAAQLGIATVGVYSEQDVRALHVDSVDVAVALGGSSPAESYLRADAIIEAALRTGADAVHPGYGFLAENADFAEQVISAGLTWVGPTPDQIRLLGDKVAAKRAALEAGVPTTDAVMVAAGDVPTGLTMPVLVKAAAGGGGRGMRVVRSEEDLASALESAAREAESAFGDGTVFIEPYIEHGRHIEVQIMGDKHGQVLHFGERECSIQRRNQKVIEESPSAGITDELRQTLCAAAVALGQHVGYESAGTVEFLVGADESITFLEVNTRLQVEHPVTEAVTGFDLVEMQLRVADGQHIGVAQDDVPVSGHAIEVRVVAEDPAADWMPSTGTVSAFAAPPDLRTDTGFRTGSIVSPDYDSLLAKVIAWGPDRSDAIRRMARGLRSTQIEGVRTNVPALIAIMEESDFHAAKTPTSYLVDHPAVLSGAALPASTEDALLAAAVVASEQTRRSGDAVTGFAPSGWRNLRTIGQRETWTDRNGSEHHVEYAVSGADVSLCVGAWPEPTEDGSLSADDRRELTVRVLDDELVAIEVDGVRYVVTVDVGPDIVLTRTAFGSQAWTRQPRFVPPERSDAGHGPISPLPGTVLAVHVAVGDAVAEGQVLMVVEAMKMEHKIVADADAVVEAIRFGVGDRVDTGDLLVTLTNEE